MRHKVAFHFKPLPECTRCVPSLLGRKTAIYSHYLNAITRFTLVHQVVIRNDIHRARELSCRGFFWHLLYSQSLVILISTQPIFCLQRIIFFILSQTRYCSDSGHQAEQWVRTGTSSKYSKPKRLSSAW